MLKLNELRESIDDGTKKLLSEILRHFQASKNWPKSRLVNSQHGKDTVIQSFGKLNVGIVEESETGGVKTYKLGILGILLTDDGPRFEQLLLRYLNYQRDLYQTNPQQEFVTQEDLLQSGFISEDVQALSSLVVLAGIYSHSCSVGEGTFQCGVYQAADQLPQSGNLDASLEAILFKHFDPSLRVFGDEKKGSDAAGARPEAVTPMLATTDAVSNFSAPAREPASDNNLKEIVNNLLAENRVHKEGMLNLITTGEAIAFVGAGLSFAVGYPGWTQLLEKLAKEAEELGGYAAPSDLVKLDTLAYAEHIRGHFDGCNQRRKYHAFIGTEYGQRLPAFSENHAKLVQLPFKGFITTNYDLALEAALGSRHLVRADSPIIVKRNGQDAHKVLDFLLSLSDGEAVHYIAHLHGCQNSTDDIILTASDYREAYGMDYNSVSSGKIRDQPWTLHRKLAWGLMATRRMIFWGFSLTDPYILGMLDAVADDLWNVNRCVHYAVVRQVLVGGRPFAQ